jgi:ferritin-like metal-binding protein YciE
VLRYPPLPEPLFEADLKTFTNEKEGNEMKIASKGLVAEGQEEIEQEGEDILRDVMLIGAAKRVEHYEMAGYQSAIVLAESMDNEEAANLLRQTLTEEEEADGKLESLCEQLLESRAPEMERPKQAVRTKAGRGV